MKIHRPIQLAKDWGVSVLTIRRLQDAGKLDRIKLGARAVGITDDSVKAYLADQNK